MHRKLLETALAIFEKLMGFWLAATCRQSRERVQQDTRAWLSLVLIFHRWQVTNSVFPLICCSGIRYEYLNTIVKFYHYCHTFLKRRVNRSCVWTTDPANWKFPSNNVTTKPQVYNTWLVFTISLEKCSTVLYESRLRCRWTQDKYLSWLNWYLEMNW